MLIAELAGLLILVAVSAFLMRRQAQFFEARVKQQDEAEEGRRQAVYKQQKSAQTAIAQQQRALDVLANQSRALHEETRLVHQRVDRHFAHPAVKRLTNEEEVS